MSNTIALEALRKLIALQDTEDHEWDAVERVIPEMCDLAREAIAALEAEPQDGDVEQALNRMDALLDPSLNLLAVSENSITLQGCRADMLTIRRALRMAPAAREGWQPIETAPKDGTHIILSNGATVAEGWWEYQEPYIREKRDIDGRYIDQEESDGFDGWLDCQGGMQPDPTQWMPLPAAQPGAQEPAK